MRIENPLIIGAGPAGTAAAIALARTGAQPLLIDRDETAGDAICGGFLSWQTGKRLGSLGVDVASIGAHAVHRLTLFTPNRKARIPLPETSWGLSRHALDTALRAQALAAGARFEAHNVRSIDGTTAITDNDTIAAPSLFLACGKHDIRPLARPREAADTTLGLRVTATNLALAALVGDAIELHLFDGGYCGIVRQEGGRVNLCMAVRKSALAAAGGRPHALLAALADQNPALAARLACIKGPHIDAIGAIPYGWRTNSTSNGLFRLGDQAAVIPSLAGEGIDIALASGIAAALAWQQDGPAGAARYQSHFAKAASLSVRTASVLWHAAESPRLAALGLPLFARFPALARLAARLTRV
jgi:menaquinone-9 beta-reductase